MKKILISGLFIHPGRVGGAEQYFYNILKGIQKQTDTSVFTILLNSEYKSDYDEIINKYNIEWVEMKRNRALYDYALVMKNYHRDAQTIFNPNYITPLQFSSKPSHITTIHDLQYLNYPEFFSKTKRLFQYLSHQYTLFRAKNVVCISEFVRQDIIKHFGKKYEAKLAKIHVPVEFSHLEQETQPFYPFEYILSVSAWFPHKNLMTLVKAFQLFQKETNSNLKLVLVGQNKNLQGGQYGEYQEKLKAEISKTENVLFTGYVSDKDLGMLYQHCSYFVFPSLFEGFGIPVIEAMGFGKPTITTRCGSLEEVSMGKAIYVEEPKNERELAEKMIDTYQNMANQKQYFQGLKNEVREQYSPVKIASQYLNLF
ncbi:hypothetical protein AD998_13810 [bacterium 336/3]|nr:hypothetical protein AD998_13810 [bacterium 336/3]